MARLSERVALVTGGARGIGRAIAEAFLREGARVVVTFARSRREALAFAREWPGLMSARPLDVTRPADVRATLRWIEEALGGLDILVNNASHSIPGSWAVELERIRIEDWQRVLDVDLTGTFLCVREAARLLRKSKHGSILNLASAAAWQGDAETFLYAPAKAGVIGLTRSLARLLAPQVRVNAIAPGSIDTGWPERWKVPKTAMAKIVEATPLRRIGRPVDVAGAAVFLASEESSFMTGQTLVVDGGIYAA